MTTAEVAKGYGVNPDSITESLRRNRDDFIEGKHYIFTPTIRGSGKKRLFSKRGIIRLGFFIKSERARKFRDWAEDFIMGETVLQKMMGDIKQLEKERNYYISENNWLKAENARLRHEEQLALPITEKTPHVCIIQAFIDENAVIEGGEFIACSVLYEAFEAWCLYNGNIPVSKNKFGRTLYSKGIVKYRMPDGSKAYHGVRLISK